MSQTAAALDRAHEVLKWMQVPDPDGKYPNVYVLGCFQRPLTFHSQQQRAFNLIWALLETGKLQPGQSVGIVGGGLAGVTAAAAAALMGIRATVIERSPHPLPLQQGAVTRWVHPNIFDWPSPDADVPQTDLPCLNWKAGAAEDIFKEVLSQWTRIRDLSRGLVAEPIYRCEITKVVKEDGRPKLISSSKLGFRLHNQAYDCVIIAVGFGIEKDLGKIESRSYWKADDLHQPVMKPPVPRVFFVTGCGDGGLLDVLRLRLDRFEQSQLHSVFVPALRREGFAGRLRDIDSEAAERSDPQVPGYLFTEYQKLIETCPLDLRAMQLRDDTVVHLNGEKDYPLDLGAAILNRVATFLLMKHDYQRFRYVPGKVDENCINRCGNGYKVCLDGIEPFDAHEIVVRHGANSALEASFSEIAHACDPIRKRRNDPTRRRMYPKDFFHPKWRTTVLTGATEAGRPKHNLPEPLEKPIGRVDEITAVKERLASHRLVTLTGAGGSGKTTLAVLIGHELLDEFGGRVWYAALGSVPSRQDVAQRIAGVLSAQETIHAGPMDAIRAFFSDQSALLILDNCEHVLHQCSETASQLLSLCPQLRILATSRESLGLERQVAFRVGPLSLPEPEAMPRDPKERLSYIRSREAVQLFADRASRVSNFQLDESNADRVAEITRKLDGIPFAVVLAAAWTDEMGVADILDGLQKRFQFLKNPWSPLLQHHQTLLTTVEWSFRLLQPGQQQLLKRLAAFIGWDLDAARAVCTGGEVGDEDFLDYHARLVGASLVERDRDTKGAARYRLLETTKEFCIDALSLSPGEYESIRNAHLAYYSSLIVNVTAKASGNSALETLTRIGLEYENIRAALGWTPMQPDMIRARLELISKLDEFWSARGYLSEGRQWLESGIESARAEASETLAAILSGAGLIAYRQGEYSAARKHLSKARDLYTRLADERNEARVLTRLGRTEREDGEFKASWDCYKRAFRSYQALEDAEGMCRSYNGLGILCSDKGKIPWARGFFKKARDIAESLKDAALLAAPLNNLGIIERNAGSLDFALELHKKVKELMASKSDEAGVALSEYNMGVVYWKKNDLEQARLSHQRCLEIGLRQGDKRLIALALEGFARLWVSLRHVPRAVRLFAAAGRIRDSISSPVEPNERADHERSLEEARAQLGASDFNWNWEVGWVMSQDDAASLTRAT